MAPNSPPTSTPSPLPCDPSGAWFAEFDTIIGVQHYTYHFTRREGQWVGRAVTSHEGERREVPLREFNLSGAVLRFEETGRYHDKDLLIRYEGKVTGEEILMTRQVGNVVTENFVARRRPQDGPVASRARRAARPYRLPARITLEPDDVPAFASAPDGFDQQRDDAPRGRVERVPYESVTVGLTRPLEVYTPPGYDPNRTYPVLYLLHGIGDDEATWRREGRAGLILDNLHADGRLTPMIVVMPNGRSDKAMTPNTPWDRQVPAFESFTQELFADIIPFVETRYPARRDREHRALAGLSMGGGQALNIGLAHLDDFAWLAAFSSAPNTRQVPELAPEPRVVAERLKLLWLSCGEEDWLFHISQRVHRYFREHQVPHVWHVEPGGHTRKVWRNDLYLLAPLLFK